MGIEAPLARTHRAWGMAEPIMPDVAVDSVASAPGKLDLVGMTAIEVALRLRDETGAALRIPARVDAFISLDDPYARGIHMSRLFLALQQELAKHEFSLAVVEPLLAAFVASHAPMSSSSHVRIAFDYLARRESLRSDLAAWRNYPVVVSGWLNQGRTTLALEVEIAYSSTCPCSAALARQVIQERFRRDFADVDEVDVDRVYSWLAHEDAICATPHGQRSHARVTAILKDVESAPSIARMIDLLETAVGTPVQAAVKREDEQEFARLNGANLMFAEDAARRLKAALDKQPGVVDYRVQVNHLESLHAHNAVAIVTKGLPNGVRA